MLELGWFSTGRGEGSRRLISTIHDHIERGDILARIKFVFSNHDPGEHEGSDRFFELVDKFGIPLITHSWRGFKASSKADRATQRMEYDKEVINRIRDFPTDLTVLAGYMLIVGPELCKRFTMLNLHPALPGGPVGTWQEVIWKLIATESKKTGAMIHLVTDKVDEGPCVSYFTFPLRGISYDQYWEELQNHSLKTIASIKGEEYALFRLIRQAGLEREAPLLAETLKALGTGKIQILEGKLYDSHGTPISSLCLNEAIESYLG